MIGMSGNHPCPPAIFHVAIENLQFPPFTDDLPIETSLYLLGQRVFMIANGRWFHQIATKQGRTSPRTDDWLKQKHPKYRQFPGIEPFIITFPH
jgi:hypothetical protein